MHHEFNRTTKENRPPDRKNCLRNVRDHNSRKCGGGSRNVGYEGDFLPYPVQNWLTGKLKEAEITHGRSDLISLWAGQGAGLLREHHAGLLMKSLIDETSLVIQRLNEN